MPEKYKENFEKWSQYDNKVWCEKELLDLCTDEQINDYFKVETLINRVNYLKYILLYNEGGIFADLDSYPVKDLEEFFNKTSIEHIDAEAKLSIRYPFNTILPERRFETYDIILPVRKTMMFYPNGDKPLLIDNPVLMSNPKNIFWASLLEWCQARTNLKSGALAGEEFLPHEPFGPYGLTDFVFSNFKEPYVSGILMVPAPYIMGEDYKNDDTYIIHQAEREW